MERILAMFKNLLVNLKKALGIKPKSLGDGLKAFKKRFGVIEEVEGTAPGSRIYNCKGDKHLDIDVVTTYTGPGKNYVGKQDTLTIIQAPNNKGYNPFRDKEFYRAYKHTYENGKRTRLTTVTNTPTSWNKVKTIIFS